VRVLVCNTKRAEPQLRISCKLMRQSSASITLVLSGVKSVEAGLSQEVQRLRSRFNDSIKDAAARIDRCEAKTSDIQLYASDVSQASERAAAYARDQLQHLASQLSAADTRLSHDLRAATGIFEAGRDEVTRSLRALEKSVGESVVDVRRETSGLHERVDDVARCMREEMEDSRGKAATGVKILTEQVEGLAGSVRGLKESFAAKMHDANKLIVASDLRAREALEQLGGQFTVAIESAQSTLALNTQRLADLERIARDDAARAQR
jgi:vacuolar-type H+-ATPase subunit H